MPLEVRILQQSKVVEALREALSEGCNSLLKNHSTLDLIKLKQEEARLEKIEKSLKAESKKLDKLKAERR